VLASFPFRPPNDQSPLIASLISILILPLSLWCRVLPLLSIRITFRIAFGQEPAFILCHILVLRVPRFSIAVLMITTRDPLLLKIASAPQFALSFIFPGPLVSLFIFWSLAQLLILNIRYPPLTLSHVYLFSTVSSGVFMKPPFCSP